jgi:hypothetical protein
MKKIILIAGLPGSGKHHLAQALAAQAEKPLVIEGLVALSELDTATLEAETLIVTAAEFCVDESRDNTMALLREKFGSRCEAAWVYLENKPCLCMENVGHRDPHCDNRKIAAEILALSRKYHIPAGCLAEKVKIEKSHPETNDTTGS